MIPSAEANRLSFGHSQLPTFDLARSNYVMCFGADFLGTWNSPVAHNVGYGAMRQGRPGNRGKFVQVECRMSQDRCQRRRVDPARLGTEGQLALAFAHVIVNEHLVKAESAERLVAELMAGAKACRITPLMRLHGKQGLLQKSSRGWPGNGHRWVRRGHLWVARRSRRPMDCSQPLL